MRQPGNLQEQKAVPRRLEGHGRDRCFLSPGWGDPRSWKHRGDPAPRQRRGEIARPLSPVLPSSPQPPRAKPEPGKRSPETRGRAGPGQQGTGQRTMWTAEGGRLSSHRSNASPGTSGALSSGLRRIQNEPAMALCLRGKNIRKALWTIHPTSRSLTFPSCKRAGKVFLTRTTGQLH